MRPPNLSAVLLLVTWFVASCATPARPVPAPADARTTRERVDAAISAATPRSREEVETILRLHSFQSFMGTIYAEHAQVEDGVTYVVLVVPDGSVRACRLRSANTEVPAAFTQRVCARMSRLYFGRKDPSTANVVVPLKLMRGPPAAPPGDQTD